MSFDLQSFFQRARQIYQFGDADRARREFESVRAAVPDRAVEMLVGQSQLELEAGHPREAALCARQVLDLAPETGQAAHVLGLALIRLRQPEAALAALSHASALGWEPTLVGATVGAALHLAGRLEDGLAQVAASLDRVPGNTEAWLTRGRLLTDLGRPQEAEAALMQGLALRPEYAPLHDALGDVLLLAGRPVDAGVAYARAFTVSGRFPQGLCRAAAVLPRALAALGRPPVAPGDLAAHVGRLLEAGPAEGPRTLPDRPRVGLILHAADLDRLEDLAAALSRRADLVLFLDRSVGTLAGPTGLPLHDVTGLGPDSARRQIRDQALDLAVVFGEIARPELLLLLTGRLAGLQVAWTIEGPFLPSAADGIVTGAQPPEGLPVDCADRAVTLTSAELTAFRPVSHGAGIGLTAALDQFAPDWLTAVARIAAGHPDRGLVLLHPSAVHPQIRGRMVQQLRAAGIGNLPVAGSADGCRLVLDPFPVGQPDLVRDAAGRGIAAVAVDRRCGAVLAAAGWHGCATADPEDYTTKALELLETPPTGDPNAPLYDMEAAVETLLARLKDQAPFPRLPAPARSPALPDGCRVAVVTPYYNEPPEVVERCHRSVSDQTFPCRHYLVADGHPLAAARDWDAVHLSLDSAHGDNGNTPRAQGARQALADGADAIAFLDVDNWYDPAHVASLVDLQRQTGAAVVTSGRVLVDPAGEPLFGESYVDENDGDRLADTSSILLCAAALPMADFWDRMPAAFGPYCDRVFWRVLRGRGYPRAHSGLPTLKFTSRYELHYRLAGRPAPPDSKLETEMALRCAAPIPDDPAEKLRYLAALFPDIIP